MIPSHDGRSRSHPRSWKLSRNASMLYILLLISTPSDEWENSSQMRKTSTIWFHAECTRPAFKMRSNAETASCEVQTHLNHPLLKRTRRISPKVIVTCLRVLSEARRRTVSLKRCVFQVQSWEKRPDLEREIFDPGSRLHSRQSPLNHIRCSLTLTLFSSSNS